MLLPQIPPTSRYLGSAPVVCHGCRIRVIYPVVTVQILVGMSVYLPQALGYYVMVYYVCGGDQKAGAMLAAASRTTWIVASLLLTVPWCISSTGLAASAP